MFAAEGGGLPSSLRRATGPEAREVFSSVSRCLVKWKGRNSDVQQSTVPALCLFVCSTQVCACSCELHGGLSSVRLSVPPHLTVNPPKSEPSSFRPEGLCGAVTWPYCCGGLCPRRACLRARRSEDRSFLSASVAAFDILAVIWIESHNDRLAADDKLKHCFLSSHRESIDVVMVNLSRRVLFMQ